MIAQIRSILPIVAAFLCFCLILILAMKYHPEEQIIKTYRRINKRLKEEKTSFFNYEKAEKFLIANGASYSLWKGINPINYLTIRLSVAAILFYVGTRFHWGAALGFGICGYFVPTLLVVYCNHRANDRMLMQIKSVYNALEVQTRAGVYITNALKECYKSLPAGRLKDALEEMAGELAVRNAFDEAVDNFNGKFRNEFVDTLCVIIKQSKETGKSLDMLGDITEEIEDMNASLLQKKKDALNRSGTFHILIILCAGIVFIIYILVQELFRIGLAL